MQDLHCKHIYIYTYIILIFMHCFFNTFHIVFLAQETKAPLPVKEVANLWEDCKDHGVLFTVGGLHKNISPAIANSYVLQYRWENFCDKTHQNINKVPICLSS